MLSMASIQKHGSKWRVQVYANGTRDSRVCRTRQEASQWALTREAELSGKKLPDKSFADALKLYAEQEAPKHRGVRWELIRLKSLQDDDLAKRKLAGLSDNDFADWRDARLKKVKPSTVAREMNLIRSVLEFVRLPPYRWIRANPMIDVKWPQTPPGRARRVHPDEVTAITKAFAVERLEASTTATQRVGLAFLFALETAMRAGEIVGLRWENVRLHERYVILPRTKNGDRREVPLSKRAVEILEALPVTDAPVFALDEFSRDTLWRKTRPKALKDLHFHDSRGEAIWRLSKKLDVLQLARVIGHRNPASLMLYYRESAAEMATLLD
jgi:integrase